MKHLEEFSHELHKEEGDYDMKHLMKMSSNENDFVGETQKLVQYKRRLKITAAAFFAFFAAVAALIGLYSKVKNLEAENKRLSDPVVKYEVASKEVSLSEITSKIKDIGELATVEYLYTDAGKYEDSAKLFGKEVPFSFTTKSFIVKWDGIIKAGVKIDEITAEVKDTDKEIIIHMPKAEILSHEIDDGSIETLDENDGLFNPVKVDDVRNFNAVCKADMEKRAVENGLLDEAYENAKATIQKLINTGVVEESGYKIIFQ